MPRIPDAVTPETINQVKQPVTWRQGARNIVSNIASDIGNDVVDEGRSLLGGILSSVKEVMPQAISAANAALAQLSYSGSTGNFQSASENITLSAKFQPIVDQYPEKIGCPFYKAAYLNTFSGFVKCEDAVFSATTATSVEEQAVEAFLNGGFFYE